MISSENLHIAKFCLACREGNRELAESLINEGLNVNVTNQNGDTGLIWATLKGQDNMVMFLIQKGADLNKKDKFGNTALMYACSKGYKNIVMALISNGADANVKNDRNETALIKACFNNNKHIVYFLLKNVKNLNLDNVKLLIWAAGNGYIKILKQLLKMGVDENEVYSDRDIPLIMSHYGKIPRTVRLSLENANDFVGINKWIPSIGDTPLLMACIGGYTDVVRILLSHGADVNMKNENFNTPLLMACIGGYKKIVELLLKKNAKIETLSRNGWIPLVYASYSERYSIVELLLKYGADVNAIDNTGNTALMFACDKSNENIVKLLLKYGADVNMADEEGDTPLIRACMENNENIAILLLKNNADINERNAMHQTALHWASDVGNLSIIEILIKYGAKLDLEDLKNETPFMWACSAGNFAAAKFLLSKGADINDLAKRNINEKTFLMKLCVICRSSDFFNWLITQYYNKNDKDKLTELINIIDNGGNTALMHACNEDFLELSEILLVNGADVQAKNNNGNTALHIVCRREGKLGLIDLLLSYGIDINIENSNGNTPFHMACGNDLVDKTNFLIERGADLEKIDAQGDNSLHIACIYQAFDVIHILIENELNVNAKNNTGKTPLIITCNRENEDIAKFLIEYGADVNSADINENTPLNIACLKNNISMGNLLILNFANLYSLLKIDKEQRKAYISQLNKTSNLKIKIRIALYEKNLNKLKRYLKEWFTNINRNTIEEGDLDLYRYRITSTNLDKIDDFKTFMYAMNNSKEIKKLKRDNIEIMRINDELKNNPLMNVDNRFYELDLNNKLIQEVALFKDIVDEVSTKNIVDNVVYAKRNFKHKNSIIIPMEQQVVNNAYAHDTMHI